MSSRTTPFPLRGELLSVAVASLASCSRRRDHHQRQHGEQGHADMAWQQCSSAGIQARGRVVAAGSTSTRPQGPRPSNSVASATEAQTPPRAFTSSRIAAASVSSLGAAGLRQRRRDRRAARFWLALNLPSSAVMAISMPTMPLSWLATKASGASRHGPRPGRGGPRAGRSGRVTLARSQAASSMIRRRAAGLHHGVVPGRHDFAVDRLLRIPATA